MSALTFRFFNTGQLQNATGEITPIHHRKQLALLAYLLMEKEVAHSRDSLMALFWAEHDTDTARNNLRVTLSRLRKLTATAEGTPSLILANHNDVQINPDADLWLDVATFEERLHQTQTHNHAKRSECPKCQPLLTEAVALYQNEFLSGLSLNDCPEFEEWLFIQRERQHLLAIDAYVDLAAFAEQNGEFDKALHFTRQQIELDPLRELAYRQQMRVLANQGERGLAVAAFERCRSVLDQELGVAPELETLTLYEKILTPQPKKRHEGVASAIMSDSHSLSHNLSHNLTQQLTPFIGREEELAQLADRLSDPDYRLITLTGPGGIGKSRLAQQAAMQQIKAHQDTRPDAYQGAYQDGIYFVSLAQVHAADMIPAAIADALSLSFLGNSKSPAEQIIEMLRDRRTLLILDNFEHLMDGVEFVLDLLQQSEGIVLLVTSRARLHVQSEDLFVLSGLPVPNPEQMDEAMHFAAVRLFCKRAHRLDKSFRYNAENRDDIVAVCRLVDGLPLAIELAASWIQDFDVATLAQTLRNDLDMLQTTVQDIAPQHRSIRAVFEHSWRLLSPAEQALLAKVSLFRGGFTDEAARQVAQANRQELIHLRHQSLLGRAPNGRYEIHELMRQFAAAKLDEMPTEQKAIRQHFYHYFLNQMAATADLIDTAAGKAHSDAFQADIDNIRTAWRFAIEERDVAIMEAALMAMSHFMERVGRHNEMVTLGHAIESASESASESAREVAEPTSVEAHNSLHASAATALARHYSAQKIRPQMEKAAALGLELATASGHSGRSGRSDNSANSALIAWNRFALCQNHVFHGESEAALALGKELLAYCAEEKLPLQQIHTLSVLGIAAYFSESYAESAEYLRAALALHQESGRGVIPAEMARVYLGHIDGVNGQLEQALDATHAYLASAQAEGGRASEGTAQHFIAHVYLRMAQYEKVVAHEEKALEILKELADTGIQGFAYYTLAEAQRHLGQVEAATEAATQALTLAIEGMNPLVVAYARDQLAEVAAQEERYDDALEHMHQAYQMMFMVGRHQESRIYQFKQARLLLQNGQASDAAELLETLLPYLPPPGQGYAATQVEFPLEAFTIVDRIMAANDDARQATFLERGQALLQSQADSFTDPALRETYLHAHPVNRYLLGK